MGWLTDWITEWLRGLLIDGIMGNFSGLFTDVNKQVGEVATQVGTSPATWNVGVFTLIKQISETVVLPIAGMILTFVMCYELISLIIDKNNMHEIDTWIFFKWFFKTAIAVMILSNTFNIVLGVFDVAQSVVKNAAGLISGSTSIPPDLLTNLETTLQSMDIGPLLGLWLQSFIVRLTAVALNIVIFVIVYGRMIEIYMLKSLAPIPFATVGNREIGHIGHNYFKSLLAIAFQGFLIMVCIAIYAVLVKSISVAGSADIIGTVWQVMGYTVLLCFTLFKTGSLAKSIFEAH